MQRNFYNQRDRKIHDKKVHMATTFEKVMRDFKLSDGIRRSQATTMARTVLKRGITNEIRIAAERDGQGWKRKLIFELTGQTIRETITKREPNYQNLTADITLPWHEEQQVKTLLISDKPEDSNQLLEEILSKKHIREYVIYLGDYAGNNTVKTAAKNAFEKADAERQRRYLETLKPKKDTVVEPKPLVVEESETGASVQKREETESDDSFEGNVELSAKEKQSIASTLRGKDFERVWQKIFGGVSPEKIIIGRNPHTDAVVKYIQELKRASTSANVQENAASILANINAL